MSPVTGRYRRVQSRLWVEPAFRALSDGEKLAALYLLSGPPTNSIGLFVVSAAAQRKTSAHQHRRSVAA